MPVNSAQKGYKIFACGAQSTTVLNQRTYALSVNFNYHFRQEAPAAEMRKKTQHGVVAPDNRRLILRDLPQSIGDTVYCLENVAVVRQAPNSRRERVIWSRSSLTIRGGSTMVIESRFSL